MSHRVSEGSAQPGMGQLGLGTDTQRAERRRDRQVNAGQFGLWHVMVPEAGNDGQMSLRRHKNSDTPCCWWGVCEGRRLRRKGIE